MSSEKKINPAVKSRGEKKIANYLLRNRLGRSRIAWCDDRLALSGHDGVPGVRDRTIAAFRRMLEKHEFVQETVLDPINCAEAHMWMQIVDDDQTARNLDMIVRKVDGRNRAHADAPCANCTQWVRKEFRSVNYK